MMKLTAAILPLLVVAFAGTASAGWTHKLSAYSTPMTMSTGGVATITLETPTDYTLGGEAPTLSLITPEGIVLKHVNRAPTSAGALSKSATSFEVILGASKKGKHTLTAEVDFSLCAAGRDCTPKTERLSFDVAVE